MNSAQDQSSSQRFGTEHDWRLAAIQAMQRTALIALILILLFAFIDSKLAPRDWYPRMFAWRLGLAIYLGSYVYAAYRLLDRISERAIAVNVIEGDELTVQALMAKQAQAQGEHLAAAKRAYSSALEKLAKRLDSKINVVLWLGILAHLLVGCVFLVLNWIADQFHTNYTTGMILLFIAISMVPWESRKWAFWQLFVLAYAFIFFGALHYVLYPAVDVRFAVRGCGFELVLPSGSQRDGLIANGAFIWGAAMLCWIGTGCFAPRREDQSAEGDRGPLYEMLKRLTGSGELADGLQIVSIATVYIVLWIAVLVAASVQGLVTGAGGGALFAYVLVTLIVPLAVAASRWPSSGPTKRPAEDGSND